MTVPLLTGSVRRSVVDLVARLVVGVSMGDGDR